MHNIILGSPPLPPTTVLFRGADRYTEMWPIPTMLQSQNGHLLQWVAAALFLTSAYAAAKSELSTAFALVDADGSGAWSVAEYATVERDVKNAPEFAAADTDGDSALTLDEVETAFPKGRWGSASKQRKALLALPAFHTARERNAAAAAARRVAPSSDEGALSYTSADGTVKTMSATEASIRLAASAKFAAAYDSSDGARLVRPGANGAIALSGKVAADRKRELAEASAVDPELAHFIQVGRFAHSKLNDAGSAFGFLVSLRPVPPPPTPPAAAATATSAGEAIGGDASAVPPPSTTQWRLTQLLTVEEPVGTDGSMVRRVYETEVEYDEKQYSMPHVALVAAWSLGEDDEGKSGRRRNNNNREHTSLAVPPPPEPPAGWESAAETAAQFMERNAGAIRTVFGVMICAALAKMARRGIGFATGAGRSTRRETGGNGGGDASAANGASAALADGNLNGGATAGRSRKSTSGGSAKKRRGDKTPKAS